jgi:hypothetical protein
MPASMKYAHAEREPRFLLAATPAQLNTVWAKVLHDRYWSGRNFGYACSRSQVVTPS